MQSQLQFRPLHSLTLDIESDANWYDLPAADGANALMVEHLGGEVAFFSATDRGLSRNAAGVLVLSPIDEVLFAALDAGSRAQFMKSRNIAEQHAWQAQMRQSQGGPKGTVTGAIVDQDYVTPLLEADRLKLRCLDGTAKLRVSRGVAELVLTF